MRVTTEDQKFLTSAVELSKSCPPTQKAFSVGAVIVDKFGKVLSDGYSREFDDSTHAEQAAMEKAKQAGIDLHGATIYSSLEPCGKRLSGRKPCAELIVEAGITRVVYAMDEPPVFVIATGANALKSAGVIVDQIPELSSRVMEINQHLHLAGDN